MVGEQTGGESIRRVAAAVLVAAAILAASLVIGGRDCTRPVYWRVRGLSAEAAYQAAAEDAYAGVCGSG